MRTRAAASPSGEPHQPWGAPENLSLKSGLRRFRERIKRSRQRGGLFVIPAVGASGTAGLGADTQCLVHDLLDRAGTAAAFGAASETAVHLPRRSRHRPTRTHRIADVVIGDDVARTDDHEGRNTLANDSSDISARGAAQKENEQFQAIPNLDGIALLVRTSLIYHWRFPLPPPMTGVAR